MVSLYVAAGGEIYPGEALQQMVAGPSLSQKRPHLTFIFYVYF